MTLPALNSIDAIIIGVLLLGVLVGTFRGTVRELFSLIAVVVAHYLARSGHAAIAPGLSRAVELPQVAGASAYILLFLACMLGVELLAHMIVRALDLGKTNHFMDHLGGLLLGSGKAYILVGILLATLAVWPQGRQGISHSFVSHTFTPAARLFTANLERLSAKQDLLEKR